MIIKLARHPTRRAKEMAEDITLPPTRSNSSYSHYILKINIIYYSIEINAAGDNNWRELLKY
jgi:hypothetical protein